jgi:16S rRNA G966 N2-methylase RsmD
MDFIYFAPPYFLGVVCQKIQWTLLKNKKTKTTNKLITNKNKQLWKKEIYHQQ